MKNDESLLTINYQLSTEKIVLVGAGNVATHLGTALRDAGYAVLQVFSRTEESASALAGIWERHCVMPDMRYFKCLAGRKNRLRR